MVLPLVTWNISNFVLFINAEKVGFENVIAKQMVAQYKLLITTGKCAPIDGWYGIKPVFALIKC